MQAESPVPDDYRKASPFLFPEIRDTWSVVKTELVARTMVGGDTLEIPYLCLAESFAAVIVYARDSLKTIIDFDQVRKWGLDIDTVFDEVLEQASKDGTQLATVLVAPLSGTLLGDRYELMDEIGRGGMGVICRAMDRLSPVAVKLLLNDATNNDIIRNRFMVEARAASSLNHPNVIRVHALDFSEDGLPYMVMEFLSGQTLDELPEEGHLDLPETIKLNIQVCDALGHAHRHNVVHRDVKPGNIVIVPDEDGRGNQLRLGAEASQSGRRGRASRSALPARPGPCFRAGCPERRKACTGVDQGCGQTR